MDIQQYQLPNVTPNIPTATVNKIAQTVKNDTNNVTKTIEKPFKQTYQAVTNAVNGAKATVNNTANAAALKAKGIEDAANKAIKDTEANASNSINGALGSISKTTDSIVKGFKDNFSKGMATLGKDFTWLIGFACIVLGLFCIKFLKDILD
jgi:ABC-type transporter lipoprotein component MlaA